jgi:hypothetical protein
METLIVELESASKAKELTSLLASLNFVKKVSSFKNSRDLIEALQDQENLKNSILKCKNKAIEKYL